MQELQKKYLFAVIIAMLLANTAQITLDDFHLILDDDKDVHVILFSIDIKYIK